MDPEAWLLAQLLSAGRTIVGGGEPYGAEFTGTKALMLAVLEEALRDYRSVRPRLRASAEAWVASARHLPFSFVVVCETLGLEPTAVRAALPRWREANAQPGRRERLRPYPQRPPLHARTGIAHLPVLRRP